MPIDLTQLKKLEKEIQTVSEALKKANKKREDAEARRIDLEKKIKANPPNKSALQMNLDGAVHSQQEANLEIKDLIVEKGQLEGAIRSEEGRLKREVDSEVAEMIKAKAPHEKEIASLQKGLDGLVKRKPVVEKEIKKKPKKAELEKLDGELSQINTSIKNMTAALKKPQDAIKKIDDDVKKLRASAQAQL